AQDGLVLGVLARIGRTRGFVPRSLRGRGVIERLERDREVADLAADRIEVELNRVVHAFRLSRRRALQRQVGDDLDRLAASAGRAGGTGRLAVSAAATSGQERESTEHQNQYRQKCPSSQLRPLVRPIVLSTLPMASI